MVYDLTFRIPLLLQDIFVKEISNRTDGMFPLLQRVQDIIINLDRQSNKNITSLSSIPTTVFYVTVEYYTIYYLHNGVDAFIVQIDKQKNAYNLRPSQKITTGVDYSSRCNCYKPYRTSQYDYFPYTFVKHIGGKGKFNLQSNDNGTTKILFDIDFDEIIPFNQYDDGYYGKGYLYGDKGWYKLFTDGEYEYHDEKENNESINHKINRIITETLNRVIRESILAENRKRKVLG